MNTFQDSVHANMTSHFVEIDGVQMHYMAAGQGQPILFLHSIPASSYIWRNVIPYLAVLGQCFAPDLIGCGRSDKPAIAYSISDHIHYIDSFINTLQLKNLTIVMHGLGSVIGFDYAMRQEKNCKGLVFYEAFLREINKDNISLPYQQQLLELEDQDNLLEITNNAVSFVDKIMPQYILRELTPDEMQNFRQPFLEKNSAKPILQFIKELPRGNGGTEVDKIIAAYSKKLTQSSLPKLMLYSLPGFLTPIATVMWAKENLPNLELIDIGEELHLAQESYPERMGETISAWLQAVEQAV